MSVWDRLFGRKADSVEQLIERIEAHPAVRQPGSRPSLDAAEYLALSDAELSAFSKSALAARSALPPVEDLVADLEALVSMRSAAALPVLSRLWQTHPLVRVRGPAGRGLLAIGSAEAHQAIRAMETDWDPLSRRVVAESLLLGRDAINVVRERLHRAASGDEAAARLLAHVFTAATRTLHGDYRPEVNEGVRAVVLSAAFLQLTADYLDGLDAPTSDLVRDFLRAAPRQRVRPLLEARPARRSPPRLTTTGAYRSTARAGWDHYAALGAIDGPLRDEAMHVAMELMRRVARNADVVTQRLRQLDWPMGPNPRSSPLEHAEEHTNPFTGEHHVPPIDLDAHLAGLAERLRAPCPVGLEAFWRVVGGIDRSPGEDRRLPTWVDVETIDPLVVVALTHSWWQVEEWERERGDEPLAQLSAPFDFGIAPDRFHKMATSGGAPYEIRMPCYDADPLVLNAPEKLRFVPYLRNAFRWGGLPGLAYVERSAAVESILKELTRDLEPF